ncbi:MAG: beta/gamma crystallin-related protein [Micropepsaceae bacterium]
MRNMSLKWNLTRIIATACILLGMLPGRLAHAEAITLYAEKDFSGQEVTIRDSVSDISATERPVSAMSLRIQESVSSPARGWLLCTVPDNQGDCLWSRDGSIRDLEPWGFARRIRSLKPVRLDLYEPYAGLATKSDDIFLLHTIQKDKNRRKDNMRAAARIRADAPDLLAYGMHDLPVAAIIVAGTLPWQLCTETNYGGRCLTTVDDVDDMAALFSDHIRSARRLAIRATQ